MQETIDSKRTDVQIQRKNNGGQNMLKWMVLGCLVLGTALIATLIWCFWVKD